MSMNKLIKQKQKCRQDVFLPFGTGILSCKEVLEVLIVKFNKKRWK